MGEEKAECGHCLGHCTSCRELIYGGGDPGQHRKGGRFDADVEWFDYCPNCGVALEEGHEKS